MKPLFGEQQELTCYTLLAFGFDFCREQLRDSESGTSSHVSLSTLARSRSRSRLLVPVSGMTRCSA